MGLNVIQPTNYGQREAEIKQRLLLAQMLNQNAQDNTPSTNQMIGNKVVPLSPFTAIANALSKGVASYQGARAQTEQGQLDDEKRNYLVKALSGGQQITPEIIANAGGSVDDLTKAAATQLAQTPIYDYLNTSKGVLRVDKRSKDAELLPYNMATADPALQGDISLQKNINKIGPVVGQDEATRYMTYGEAAGMQNAPNSDNPYIDGIWNNESSQGNDPNLRNPTSSAKGPFQITNGTREAWGLPSNSTPEQDRATVEKVQKERADKYGSTAMAALSHMTGEGRMNEIQQGSPLKPEEISYLGKLVAYAYQKEKGVRSPTRQEKDAREIQKDVAKERLLSPVKKDFEGFKTDENIRQKEAEIEAQKLAPLPQAVLKERTDLLDDISTNSSIVADLGTIKKQVDSGNLNLGFFKNLALKGKAYAGSNDTEVLNYNTYITSLEKLRNDSLRLNKGIQTDSDARRAWDEIMGNPYNSAIVSKRLEEIQNINSRAMEIKKNLVNAIHDNYGKPKYDFSAFENQKPAINTSQDPELDAILKQYGNK